MKSFRAGRQQKNASVQVIAALLLLVITVLIMRLVPVKPKAQTSNRVGSWETSVVNLP